jgi:hypothetical protein
VRLESGHCDPPDEPPSVALRVRRTTCRSGGPQGPPSQTR